MNGVLATAHPYIVQYGYGALFGVLFAESLGLPVPGETFLVAASFLAVQGQLSIWLVGLTAWVAAALGDNVGYAVGRFGGRRLVVRHGARVGISAARLNKTERFFAHYGPEVVIVARFFPVLRQLNGIAAGSAGMDWKRFLPYNALGALLWVGAWSTGVYYFGRQIEVWLLRVHTAELWLAGALVLALLVAAVYWAISKRSCSRR
ncbi:MAG TPA: DedA family protein [Burkholderiales bacterium]|nr:DedA family protein [Burkholderiales bacterium]